MRKLFVLVMMICALGACKKAVEDKREEVILDAMTNGQWYVYSYTEADKNLTTSFAPYSFQFYRDRKVSGFTATTEDKGTWEADPENLTISAFFPTAGDPVKKLNAVWKVTNNSWDYVKAETTVDGILKKLYLKKKE